VELTYCDHVPLIWPINYHQVQKVGINIFFIKTYKNLPKTPRICLDFQILCIYVFSKLTSIIMVGFHFWHFKISWQTFFTFDRRHWFPSTQNCFNGKCERKRELFIREVPFSISWPLEMSRLTQNQTQTTP
jgi:hypothetical protein